MIAWRRVVSHRYVGASRYTGYLHKSIELTFECGHTDRRKASSPSTVNAKCRECAWQLQEDRRKAKL